MSTLKIKDLHVTVDTDGGAKEILKGVTLTINAGETHAIMGPNGSGKSTLAYSIAGHPKYDVTGGTVTLDGEDLLAVAGERDVLTVDVHAEGRVVAEVGERTGAVEGHQPSFRTFLDSSASTVAASCSSRAGTSMRRIRSLKKPCTTRRRASFSSMPRERR